MLVSLACAIAFNMLFVRRTVSFIVGVVKAMRRVERGDLTTRVAVVGNDETTSLSKSFNSLIRRISELLEEVKQEQHRKRKAEMMVLQAQIKPHFLFNTLESINILAVQNEGRKVSKMVQQLARILRISIQQKEEILLRKNWSICAAIWRSRNIGLKMCLNLKSTFRTGFCNEHILKLTLQPLVENSIQHGFRRHRLHGAHSRDGAGRGRKYRASYVEDNGIGIPQERLAQHCRNKATRHGGDLCGIAGDGGAQGTWFRKRSRSAAHSLRAAVWLDDVQLATDSARSFASSFRNRQGGNSHEAESVACR